MKMFLDKKRKFVTLVYLVERAVVIYLFLFYFFNYNGLQSWCTENCVNKLLARVKCIILPILSQSHNRNLKIKNLNPLSTNPIKWSKTLSAKFVGNIKQFVGASFKGVEKWCIENKLVH